MTPASRHCWLRASPGLATAVLTWGCTLHSMLCSLQTFVYSLLTSCACSMQSLLMDALSQGKTLGLQNKQRGAVVLRKALDKLAADFEKVRAVSDAGVDSDVVEARQCRQFMHNPHKSYLLARRALLLVPGHQCSLTMLTFHRY
jgi:hypothetical protein